MRYSVVTDEQENWKSDFLAVDGSSGFTFDWKPLPGLGIIAAPFGVGAQAMTSIPNNEFHLEIVPNVGFAGDWNSLQDSYSQATETKESDLSISFSYTTQNDPDKAGPPSDALLVPSTWFEIRNVWQVAFYTSACAIVGFSDVIFVANEASYRALRCGVVLR